MREVERGAGDPPILADPSRAEGTVRRGRQGAPHPVGLLGTTGSGPTGGGAAAPWRNAVLPGTVMAAGRTRLARRSRRRRGRSGVR